ncbi:glucose / sorbosone dehydrogenase domain-containing protein [Ditylenchus destructor]|nr:glucose / sorbosone dehydrogenase domain-containing protein [Ditylenchus destructor]
MKGSPSQDLQQTLGKVVRVNRDGGIPADNPKFSTAALPGIWSYGHRNIQGAALHPTTGELWITEHGPQGGDEVNISRAGQNYGWPTRATAASTARRWATPAASAAAPMRRPMSSRSPPGRRSRSRRPGWPSTPGTCSRSGAASCSPAPGRDGAWRLTLDGDKAHRPREDVRGPGGALPRRDPGQGRRAADGDGRAASCCGWRAERRSGQTLPIQRRRPQLALRAGGEARDLAGRW